MLNAPTIARFRSRLKGQLLMPGDATYDGARRVFNAMIDRRPAMIVQCAGTSDVIAGVSRAPLTQDNTKRSIGERRFPPVPHRSRPPSRPSTSLLCWRAFNDLTAPRTSPPRGKRTRSADLPKRHVHERLTEQRRGRPLEAPCRTLLRENKRVAARAVSR
jgi:hypothetical protein